MITSVRIVESESCMVQVQKIVKLNFWQRLLTGFKVDTRVVLERRPGMYIAGDAIYCHPKLMNQLRALLEEFSNLEELPIKHWLELL